MDSDDFDFEATETLDFLSPPVQRAIDNTERIVATDFNNQINNIYLLRDFRTKFTQNTQYPELERTIINSSTSLILKKTTKAELRKQYSILDYTYLQHSGNQRSNQSPIENLQQGCSTRHKPIIRVTVIPNDKRKSKTEHKKRKHRSVRIQSSVSNQESSIKAKNVYLVVSGKKTEKIYEVKTTGSAEFANSPHYLKKDEDIHVESLGNLKGLIKSLDMDKKKKKSKKIEDARKHSNSSLVNDIFYRPESLEGETMYIDKDKDKKNHKSRVRLTGRIGLTGDEGYVLNCAATVNDKPVETNFTQQRSYKTHQSTMNDQGLRNFRCQKDSIIQADFPNENSYCRNVMMNALRCKETQCSPASFNSVCFTNIDKLKIFSNKDQTIQCNCDDFFVQSTDAVDNNNTFNTFKANPSPLVIISVYTKPDSSQESTEIKEAKQVNNMNKTRLSQQKTNALNVNIKQQMTGAKQNADSLNKSVNKLTRTRSPSPSKSYPKQKVEKKKNQTKATSKKSTNKESNPQSTSNINKQRKGKNSKEVPSKSSLQKQSKTISKKQPNLKVERGKPLTPKGINMDRILTKKAIVDNFSKKVVKKINEREACKRWGPPKKDMSNVSVNIDGNMEFYDVLFRQGDLTTDLQVRRTLKEKESQKHYDDDDHSLENFLLLDDMEPRRRSFSQTYLANDQPNDSAAFLKPVSRITLRDSVEISHRRDEKLNVVSAKGPQKQFSFVSNSSDSLYNESGRKLGTPVKHFRGDDCALPNPLQRDREVRELLGVNKGRQNVRSSKIKKEPDAASQELVHYFYETRRLNQNVTLQKQDSKYSFFKLFPPCFCPEYEQGQQTETRNLDPTEQFTTYSSPHKHSTTHHNSGYCSEDTERLQTDLRELEQATRFLKAFKKMNVDKSSKHKVKSEAAVQSDSNETKKSDPQTQMCRFCLRMTRKLKARPTQSDSNPTEELGPHTKKPITKSSKPKSKPKTSLELNSTEETDQRTKKVSKSRTSIQVETRDLEQARPFKKQSMKMNADESRKDKVKSGITVRSDSIAPEKSTKKSGLQTKKGISKSSKLKSKPKTSESDSNPIEVSDSDKEKVNKSRKSKHKFKTFKSDSNQTEESDSEQKKVSKSRKSKPNETKDLEQARTFKKSNPKHKQSITQNIECECSQPESNLTEETDQRKEKVTKSRKYKSKVQTSQSDSSATEDESDHHLKKPVDKFCNVEAKSESYSQYELSDKSEVQWTKCLNYKTKTTQCEYSPPLYQQLILNRNINVYLQIEQFTKQKPIVLTRKQYDKVKRTIEYASYKRLKMTVCKRNSSVSLEVRKKDCSCLHYDRQVQTDTIFNEWVPQVPIFKPPPRICDNKFNGNDKYCQHSDFNMQSCRYPKKKFHCKQYRQNDSSLLRRKQYYCGMVQSKTFGDDVELGPDDSDEKRHNEKNDAPKHTASSMELRYANEEYLKSTTFSSTDFVQYAAWPSATKVDYRSDSVHTIFKGHRKTPTPNLGTSAYSLYSDYSIPEAPKVVAAQVLKQRKPFLRRLMSCLVMRSVTSELKIPVPRKTDFNSSVDSYHISTSLGAIELSSSIYDTSDSFYSNHTIGPINTKMKRSFFSSVRGFLNRRS